MELVPQIHLIFVKSSFLEEFKTLNIARSTPTILGKHFNFFASFLNVKHVEITWFSFHGKVTHLMPLL